MQIRTILYQYIKTLIKHVFVLNFTHELLMSFRSILTGITIMIFLGRARLRSLSPVNHYIWSDNAEG